MNTTASQAPDVLATLTEELEAALPVFDQLQQAATFTVMANNLTEAKNGIRMLNTYDRPAKEHVDALRVALTALRAAQSTPAAVPVAQTQDVALSDLEKTTIQGLLDLAYAAWNVADNSESLGRFTDVSVSQNAFQTLSDALDKLDSLPDDQPGYVMEAAAKAGWALRRFELVSATPAAVPPSVLGEPINVDAYLLPLPVLRPFIYAHPRLGELHDRLSVHKYAVGYAVDCLRSALAAPVAQSAAVPLVEPSEEQITAALEAGLFLNTEQSRKDMRKALLAAFELPTPEKP